METKTIYKCLIVDDETLARILIRTHLLQIPELEVVHECSSAIEADQYLKTHKVDLLFLDIQMQHLSGIDFLKSLENPPKVIFTTAYSEFALDGYELNVVDYLLKPITFERFYKAAHKALELLNLENENKEVDEATFIDKSIVIKSSYQHIKILLTDILFIEGLHKYVKIVTEKKNYTTLITLSAMEEELPVQQFYRCHRSFIVNLSKVELIDGNQAIIGTHKIPISKLNKQEFLTKLGKKIG
jgi:DNA-binding LytR/AlgR family response regulator